MKTNNETVEQVGEDLEKYICGDDDIVYSLTGDEATEYKDRFLAAHKREIAAKDAEIKQLRIKLSRVIDVTGDCCKCQEEGDESCPWYGDPDGCNNREACAKFFDGKLVDPIKVKDEEIASLRALVKELADALVSDGNCLKDCKSCGCFNSCEFNYIGPLVAKAREVCK